MYSDLYSKIDLEGGLGLIEISENAENTEAYGQIRMVIGGGDEGIRTLETVSRLLP